MALLICGGFEHGNNNLERITATGTQSAAAGSARTGDFGLLTNPATTAVGAANMGGVRATVGDTTAAAINTAPLYFDFAFKINTLPSANSEEFFQILNQGSTAMLSGRVNSTGTFAAYMNATTLLATSAATLSTGTWYWVQVKQPTGAAGAWELKIWSISGDGNALAGVVETLSGTNDFTFSATNPGSIYLGKVVNRNGETVSYSFDDWFISDTDYHGLGRVSRLDPNEDGTMDWSALPADPGAGSRWSQVDDNAHDSDTTYMSSSTSGQVSLFGFETAANAGIAPLLSISGVKLVTAVRDVATGGESLIYRILSGASASSSSGNDPGSSYRGGMRFLTTDPATSAAWTESGINAVQGGVVNNANVEVRCTQVAMMVGWKPVAGASDDMNRLLLLGVG